VAREIPSGECHDWSMGIVDREVGVREGIGCCDGKLGRCRYDWGCIGETAYSLEGVGWWWWWWWGIVGGGVAPPPTCWR